VQQFQSYKLHTAHCRYHSFGIADVPCVNAESVPSWSENCRVGSTMETTLVLIRARIGSSLRIAHRSSANGRASHVSSSSSSIAGTELLSATAWQYRPSRRCQISPTYDHPGFISVGHHRAPRRVLANGPSLPSGLLRTAVPPTNAMQDGGRHRPRQGALILPMHSAVKHRTSHRR
jgi:hypothetical protein